MPERNCLIKHGFLFWITPWFTIFLLLLACPELPGADLPKPEWIVDAAWLKAHLSTPKLIIVDTRADEAYSKGHIPDAIHLEFADLYSKTTSLELGRFHEALAKRLSQLAYTGQEQVIFYDAGDGMRACRALWDFTYAGGTRGGLLAGGLKAWLEAGGWLAWDRLVRVPFVPFNVKENSAMLADIEYVSRRQHDFTTILLDVRSESEYRGADPAAGGNGRQGHIPGARWLALPEILDANQQFLPLDVLLPKLAQAGITSDKELIVYCHRGNRASVAYWALLYGGFPKVRNYLGSWQEWSARLDLPVESDASSAAP